MKHCNELNAQANTAMKNGLYQEALEKFDAMISTCPPSPDGYIGRFKVFYSQKKWDECLKACEVCLLKYPGDSTAVRHKGFALIEQGRLTEAWEFSLSVLRDHPGMLQAYLVLAKLNTIQKQWYQCLEVCANGLETHPSNLGLLNFKADALLQLGRLKESRQVYAHIATLYPASEFSARGEAKVTFRMGLWRECVAACSIILRKNPQRLQFLRLKVDSLIALGERQEAADFMDATIVSFWKTSARCITREALRQSTDAQRRVLDFCRKALAECGEHDEVVQITRMLDEYPQIKGAMTKMYGPFSDTIDPFDNAILGEDIYPGSAVITSSPVSLIDDDLLSIDGDYLLGLAEVLDSRLQFLVEAKNRKRVRKDHRLAELGVGIHFDVESVLEGNLNSIAFLAHEALKRGAYCEESYLLLAKSLYELGWLENALKVVTLAQDKKLYSLDIEQLHRKILLEMGDSHSLEHYATLKGVLASKLCFYDVIDYGDFAQWASYAEAEMVTSFSNAVDIQGEFRCVVDSAMHKFNNSIRSDDLIGARIYDLEVKGGNIPCVKGKAYYDAGLIRGCGISIASSEVSKSRIAGMAIDEPTHLSGKYIIPCGSIGYYNNYFHATCQIYSRVVHALGNERVQKYKLLLPQDTPQWGLDFLECCGIGPERIHIAPRHNATIVEEALVLPMKWDICPAEITATRDALGVPERSDSERVNYYMVRNNTKNNTRALANEDEFIDICSSRGFQIVDPLDYTIQEQIKLFQNAGVIATGASSAFTNMLYAISGAKVVIISPKMFWGMLCTDLACSCGHSISYIFGEYLARAKEISHPHNPYTANPSMFQSLLDDVLLPEVP